MKPLFPKSSGGRLYSSKVVLIEYGFASRNTPQVPNPIWGYRALNANTSISDIRTPCFRVLRTDSDSAYRPFALNSGG
jgi:hypothetical protein